MLELWEKMYCLDRGVRFPFGRTMNSLSSNSWKSIFVNRPGVEEHSAAWNEICIALAEVFNERFDKD